MTTDTQLFNKIHFLNSFYGVYSRNDLPNINDLPASIIANTDTTEQPGHHWIAMYIDENRKGEYFDSYGFPPLNQEFINFLNENCYTWSYNTIILQGISSITCGQFCVTYILMRTVGLEIGDIVHLFTDDYETNDAIVKSIFHIL